MTTKPRQTAKAYTKVSEWIAAGNLATGLALIECAVERETDKAIGFRAQRGNEFGNLKPAIAWFPKAQVRAVANDFYAHGPATAHLVPGWLFGARNREGYVL